MYMTRREFMIKSGIAAVFSIAAGMAAGGTMKAFCSTDDRASGRELRPEHREILRYASLAPSGHNAQPWEISVKNHDTWEIGLAEARTLPEVDPHNREAKLSLGAFLANLEIAATAHGFSAEFDFSGGSDKPRFAAIRIKQKNVKTAPENLSLIENRYTHRGALNTKDLKSQVIRDISENSPAVHYIPGSSSEGRNIGIATIEANRAQSGRRAAMVELSQWIRWSENDAEKFPAGITPESMGISGIPLWIVKHFYGPEDVLKPGFMEKTVESAAASVNNCGGWIVITSGSEHNRCLAETGMLFEKMFLKSRAQGIGIHPMTQVLEEKDFMENINSITGIKEKIQFVIRTGYADKFPAYRKLRLPPEYYTRC